MDPKQIHSFAENPNIAEARHLKTERFLENTSAGVIKNIDRINLVFCLPKTLRARKKGSEASGFFLRS
jgi:hypothetical protein